MSAPINDYPMNHCTKLKFFPASTLWTVSRHAPLLGVAQPSLPPSLPQIPHNFKLPSTLLLTPSFQTYPSATGLLHPPPPACTPAGALFSLSVKNTGCLFDASRTICCGASRGLRSIGKAVGGMASIWFRGCEGGGAGIWKEVLVVRGGEERVEDVRVCCWFVGGGGW